MQIDFLKEYIELAKTLNFGLTARRLHLSQSALTNHIKALEKDLGATLIERRSPSCLTNEGKLFLLRATQIVDIYKEAIDECRGFSASRQGSLRVALPHFESDGALFYLECMRLLKKKKMATEVTYTNIVEIPIWEAVKEGIADCGLVAITVNEPSDLSERFGLEFVAFHREQTAAWIDKESRLSQIDRFAMPDFSQYRIPLRINDPYFDVQKYCLEESFRTEDARVEITVCCPETSEEYFFDCFGKKDLFFGPKSYFDRNSIFQFRDDRVVRELNPPVFTTAYFGFRKGDQNPLLQEIVQMLKQGISSRPAYS